MIGELKLVTDERDGKVIGQRLMFNEVGDDRLYQVQNVNIWDDGTCHIILGWTVEPKSMNLKVLWEGEKVTEYWIRLSRIHEDKD